MESFDTIYSWFMLAQFYANNNQFAEQASANCKVYGKLLITLHKTRPVQFDKSLIWFQIAVHSRGNLLEV